MKSIPAVHPCKILKNSRRFRGFNGGKMYPRHRSKDWKLQSPFHPNDLIRFILFFRHQLLAPKVGQETNSLMQRPILRRSLWFCIHPTSGGRKWSNWNLKPPVFPKEKWFASSVFPTCLPTTHYGENFAQKSWI